MPNFCPCSLVVEVTVDSKANEAEKTREVADIRIYHFSWNFPQKRCDELRPCCLASKFFHIFDMSDNIRYMGNGGQ